MANICQMCGTSNDAGVHFCCACGSPLSGGDDKLKDGGTRDTAAGTAGMGAAATQAMPQVPSNPPKKAAVIATVKPVVVAEKPKPPMATPSQPPAKPPATLKPGDSKRTVLGMSPVSMEMAQKLKERPPMATPSEPPAPPKRAGADKRTVLGMPAVVADDDGRPTLKKPVQTAPAEKAKEEKEKSALPTEPAGAKAAGPTRQKEPLDDWPEDGARSRRLPVAWISVAVVVIVGLIAVLAYLLLEGGKEVVRPEVFRSADGEEVTIDFTLPKAPPGSEIKVAGQTAQVARGEAQVRIKTSELKLGSNPIPVVYTEPGKEPELSELLVYLPHTVSSDLAGLAAEEPFVAIDFRLAPDVALSVEGKPVQAAGGAYSHKVKLADLPAPEGGGGETLMIRTVYQITDPSGGKEQGQYSILVPVTKLQIDRPAPDAVVDAEAVTCAGVTDKGAEVAVNGQPVGVTAAGFNASVPLPAMGEHRIRVTARAPGKAPRTLNAAVTRIESLAGAIADWSKDIDRKLDYPTLGRNPNALLDKKIALSGRVVNINTEKGVTAFLLYIAEGCPSLARCAVYVVFRGETDAGLQSWVDVYGQVRGTRAVDLPNGDKLEVPAVEAKFVVKGDPKKRARGRR